MQGLKPHLNISNLPVFKSTEIIDMNFSSNVSNSIFKSHKILRNILIMRTRILEILKVARHFHILE